jgi:DNA-binding transcriptional regulator YiaG
MELMQKIALSAGCKVVFCGGDDILVSHRDRCVLVNLAPEFKDIFYDHTGSGLIFDCAFGDSLSAAHQNLNDTKGFNLNDTLKTLELLPSSLKLSRLRLGLTQQELADRLGVAYQQVQRYERTEYKNISLKRLRVIVTELIHNPEN